MSRMHADDGLENKSRLASPTIYEIISREGTEELARPYPSLAWSAFVAGICISFSLFCEGFLKLHSPEGADFYLLENVGYVAGFLIVILGRLQLFTENTITVVLPLLEKFTKRRFVNTMKLWGIVLGFNLAGTFLVALLITHFSFFSHEQMDVFLDISDHAVNRNFDAIFLQGIPAGFLIAALVWMLPSAEGSKFWVIFAMIYIIALGDMAHVVAGSGEAFLLVLNGQTSIAHCFGYIFMACLGNILGGTGLFAVMAYAQVKDEMQ